MLILVVRLLTGDLIHTEDILTATPRPEFDGFSYHAFGASSMRCEAPGKLTMTADAALSEEWLSTTERTYASYAALRDRYQPGKPVWLTETGEAACGGNPWAKTFLLTFHYLDQLGRLARHGVHTVMHNTLAVSEYALIDRETLEPRPRYWVALLWRRLMGTTVLDSGPLPAGPERGRDAPRHQPQSLELPMPTELYALTAQNVEDIQVRLNGAELRLQADGELPTPARGPHSRRRASHS